MNEEWIAHRIFILAELKRASDERKELTDKVDRILLLVGQRENATKLWIAAIAAIGGGTGAALTALISALV